LIVAVVVVAVLLVFVFLSRTKTVPTNETTTTPVSEGTNITLGRVYESPEPVSSVTPLKPSSGAAAKPSATPPVPPVPTPTPGPFDSSREEKIATDPIMEKSVNKFVAENKGKDVCQLTNISSSWANPVEKAICGFTTFTTEKILQPLMELSCNLYAAAINLNYSEDVSVTFIDNKCIAKDPG